VQRWATTTAIPAPTFYFGNGFGDLPIGWARAFATGKVWRGRVKRARGPVEPSDGPSLHRARRRLHSAL
jgi:hypothetical protein